MSFMGVISLGLLGIATFSLTTAQDLHEKHAVCDIDPNAVVDTDPEKHRYRPFMIKLPRCVGEVATFRPNFMKCVADVITNKTFIAVDAVTFEPRNLTLKVHTSCKRECTISKNSCNKFQKWDPSSCVCVCQYSSKPISVCQHPKVWLQQKCNCGCPTFTRKCSTIKEWSANSCACSCKKRYMNRCAKKRKVINEERCNCVEPPRVLETLPPMVVVAAASRGHEVQCEGGILNSIVAAIAIMEFTALITIFLLWRYPRHLKNFKCLFFKKCLGHDRPEENPFISDTNSKSSLENVGTTTRV